MLNSLIKEVDADYADYEPTNAARKVQNFVDEHLSNWYVRLCRRRFWKGDYSQDKVSAYQTLYECMETIAKLMSPVSPFFAEWLFANLNQVTGRDGAESVHLSDFPQVNEAAIDPALEQRMDYAQRISSLVRSLRKREKLRVRQPLQKVMLPILDADFQSQVEKVKDLVLAEVNVKEFEYLTETEGIIQKKVKPNFKTLGRRLGKHMKAAAQAIAGLSQDDIAAIERTGTYTLNVNGEQYELTTEDLEITAQDIPGWLVANDGALTIALDITLTDALVAEGMARELVNRIQNLRKDKDFNVTDRIEVSLQKHEAVEAAVAQFGDYIQHETLANTLNLKEELQGDSVELPDGLTLHIEVARAN